MILDGLLFCGMLVGPSYLCLYLLGGALRPGYSHVSHSVSELVAPGAPFKALLTVIQVVYALFHVAFGLGVLEVVRSSAGGATVGSIGAWTIVALGVATLGTALFPQDPEGSPATRAGKTHKLLVFGVLIPASLLSTVLVALWSRQAGVLAGFDVYSYITVGAFAVMGAVGGAATKTRFMGLAERVAALVTHQWLFVLALLLL